MLKRKPNFQVLWYTEFFAVNISSYRKIFPIKNLLVKFLFLINYQFNCISNSLILPLRRLDKILQLQMPHPKCKFCKSWLNVNKWVLRIYPHLPKKFFFTFILILILVFRVTIQVACAMVYPLFGTNRLSVVRKSAGCAGCWGLRRASGRPAVTSSDL